MALKLIPVDCKCKHDVTIHRLILVAVSGNAVNPLTAGAAYIRVFIFYQHIKYPLLNMLKIKYDIIQQYLKIVDLHFVKCE